MSDPDTLNVFTEAGGAFLVLVFFLGCVFGAVGWVADRWGKK